MVTIDPSSSPMSEPMRIAYIGAVATLLAGVLAGVIALLILWVQGKMTRRAVEAQERAVFLDLIERRSAWFDSAQNLWTTWLAEQEGHVEAVLLARVPETETAMRYIAQSRREARWLFGPEVIHHLDKLEAAVRHYGARRLKLREVSMMPESERRQVDTLKRHTEFTDAIAEVMSLQTQLGNVLAPYLYVGDIRLPDTAG